MSTSTTPATTPRKWRVTVLISGSGSNLGALLAALPTTLSQCSIVSVISNAKDAYGLTRASSHSPPIPASSYSPYNHQKANPSLYSSYELELKQLSDSLKSLDPSSPEYTSTKKTWEQKKKALSALIKPAYQLELAKQVRTTQPDLIVLAGFMLVLLPETLETLRRDWDEPDPTVSPYPTSLAQASPIPIINLHPALPNSFVGPHVIEDAWEACNQRALPGSTSTEFGPKIDQTGIMIHRVIPELDRGEPVLWKEIEMKEGEELDELKERIHKVEHGAIVEAVAKVTEMLGDGSWWS